MAGTLDGTAGLAGTGEGGESLHGTLIASLGWTQSPSDGRPVSWSAYLSALAVEGRGPSGRYLGDFLAVSNTEAHESTRLYEWWAEAGHGAWSLRAGALLADAEFAGTTAGGFLLNSAFGWLAFISSNALNAGPAYYAAALGVRLAREADTWSWRLGVYDGDSFDSAAGKDRPNRHGTSYRLGSDQGAFVISEITCSPSASANRYLAGVWAHSADFADIEGGSDHSGNFGGYVACERTLAGRSGEVGNLEAHLRAGFAPDDRNAVAWAADAALAYTGLLPSRPEDTTAIGFVHAALSDAPGGGLDHEQVAELSYSCVLGPHFTLQPDLQYVRHPGGDASRDAALVGTLRLSVSY